MSALCLHVEPIIGKDLPDVAKEMQQLSDRLGINVSADLNGVQLMSIPGNDFQNIVNQYHDYPLVLKRHE